VILVLFFLEILSPLYSRWIDFGGGGISTISFWVASNSTKVMFLYIGFLSTLKFRDNSRASLFDVVRVDAFVFLPSTLIYWIFQIPDLDLVRYMTPSLMSGGSQNQKRRRWGVDKVAPKWLL